MNTLFNTTFETEEASHHEECVRLRPQTYDLQESNVHLKLTIVDAVGFGDQINKDERQEAGKAAPPRLSPSPPPPPLPAMAVLVLTLCPRALHSKLPPCKSASLTAHGGRRKASLGIP